MRLAGGNCPSITAEDFLYLPIFFCYNIENADIGHNKEEHMSNQTQINISEQIAVANLYLQAAENQSSLSRYIDKLVLEPDNEYVKSAIEYLTKAANAYKRALSLIEQEQANRRENLAQIPRINR